MNRAAERQQKVQMPSIVIQQSTIDNHDLTEFFEEALSLPDMQHRRAAPFFSRTAQRLPHMQQQKGRARARPDLTDS
jgi:hypothetical protein